jgi:uncharacterized membrane protein
MQSVIPSAHAPQEPFRAVLTPHRSLGLFAFRLLMFVFGGASLVMGLVFAAMGAWPVFGFFGLDVGLLYLAFRVNYRQARAAEIIELTDHALAVTQISPAGQRHMISFNPAWVRVELEELRGDVCRMVLASRGERLVVAGCLSDPERREFAHALRGVLARYRGLTP